jgi:hypothetical protein
LEHNLHFVLEEPFVELTPDKVLFPLDKAGHFIIFEEDLNLSHLILREPIVQENEYHWGVVRWYVLFYGLFIGVVCGVLRDLNPEGLPESHTFHFKEQLCKLLMHKVSCVVRIDVVHEAPSLEILVHEERNVGWVICVAGILRRVNREAKVSKRPIWLVVLENHVHEGRYGLPPIVMTLFTRVLRE